MMALPSEQCIRALGEKLKKVKESKVGIDLGNIAYRITKQNNKSKWYMSDNVVSKEITFLNSLSKLQGISITTRGEHDTKNHSIKYPAISFENKEAVKVFLKEMIECKAILNSIFCYAGSGRIYKQIQKEIFGSKK